MADDDFVILESHRVSVHERELVTDGVTLREVKEISTHCLDGDHVNTTLDHTRQINDHSVTKTRVTRGTDLPYGWVETDFVSKNQVTAFMEAWDSQWQQKAGVKNRVLLAMANPDAEEVEMESKTRLQSFCQHVCSGFLWLFLMAGALAVAAYNNMASAKTTDEVSKVMVQVTGDSCWAKVQNFIERHRGVCTAVLSIFIAALAVVLLFWSNSVDANLFD